MSLKEEYLDFLQKIQVGIHEVSKITSVPARKIRYWQEKGYIEEVETQSSARQYDLLNIKKIILIQDLLDDGYTLEASSRKVEQKIAKLNNAFELILPI